MTFSTITPIHTHTPGHLNTSALRAILGATPDHARTVQNLAIVSVSTGSGLSEYDCGQSNQRGSQSEQDQRLWLKSSVHVAAFLLSFVQMRQIKVTLRENNNSRTHAHKYMHTNNITVAVTQLRLH